MPKYLFLVFLLFTGFSSMAEGSMAYAGGEQEDAPRFSAEDTISSSVVDSLKPVEVSLPERDSVVEAEDRTPVAEASKELYLTRYLRYFDTRREDRIDTSVLMEEYFPASDQKDSIYETRLNNLNSLIHLPYNEKVRANIEVYVNKKRMQTRVMLALSKYYFPIFEAAFAQHNLPSELKYLAIIESALDPSALSRAGAAGLWQFMYRTGKMYGLKVDSKIDERLDPNKSTLAAALYLQHLHNRYKDWTLALAAYNCGPGTVDKAIARARGKRDYWEIYDFLPRETRGYVPAFIGATYAMNYHREHGIFPDENDEPEILDTLMIGQSLSFEKIEQLLGISVQELRDINPQYKQNKIFVDFEAMPLRLPVALLTKFVELGDSVFALPADEKLLAEETNAKGDAEVNTRVSKVTYVIKRGDNLGAIARRFGVSVDQIKTWNGLKSDLIHPKQTLSIQTPKKNMRDMSKDIPKEEVIQNPPTVAQTYTPARETVVTATTPSPRKPQSTLAQAKTPAQRPTPSATPTERPRVATTQPKNASERPVQRPAAKPAAPKATPKPAPKPATPQLKSATGNMRSAQVAVIPSKNTQKSAQKMVYYKVSKGETLFSIHRKHQGSNIQDIIQMNNLKDNGNKIYPNQVLKIRIQ